MSEWYTAVPSHNVGNTVATDASFLLLATFYGINAKSLARQRNPSVPTAEQNLRGPLRETATWPTRNVSNDEVHKIAYIIHQSMVSLASASALA